MITLTLLLLNYNRPAQSSLVLLLPTLKQFFQVTVIVNQSANYSKIQNEVGTDVFFSSNKSLALDSDFIYAPDKFISQIHADDLISAIHSISFENSCNFVLISHKLDLDCIFNYSLMNSILFSNTAYRFFCKNKHLADLNFKLFRFPREDKNLINLTPKFSSSFSVNIASQKPKIFRTLESFNNFRFLFSIKKFSKACTYSSKKKSIFVFPIFMAVGGVERNTIEVMGRLKDKYDFYLITSEKLSLSQGSLSEQAKKHSIVIEMSESISQKNHLKYIKFLKDTISPSLVWVCNGSPWLLSNSKNFRRLFKDIPIVDQQVYDTKEGWINVYGDSGIQSFDRFIAINSKIHAKFVKTHNIPENKINLIYPVINSSQIEKILNSKISRNSLLKKYNLPQNKKLFAFVGRLTEQKDPLMFMKLAMSRAKNSNEHYVMVGNGDLGKLVNNYATEKSMGNITFIEYIDNVPLFYKLISGLIITSHYEGLPISMIEALCMGVPVFSTSVGDIDIVLDKYNCGYHYKKNISFENLLINFAKWLDKLPFYNSQLSKNKNLIIEKFSINSISKKYLECFTSALNEYKK